MPLVDLEEAPPPQSKRRLTEKTSPNTRAAVEEERAEKKRVTSRQRHQTFQSKGASWQVERLFASLFDAAEVLKKSKREELDLTDEAFNPPAEPNQADGSGEDPQTQKKSSPMHGSSFLGCKFDWNLV